MDLLSPIIISNTDEARMTKFFALNGNSQRLDGGAMFGHVPKALWSQWLVPDESNRITLACRTLLIQEEGGRNILLETGIGAFFSPEMRSRYGVVESDHVLLKSLAEVGLTHEDIDVVVISHLHFDHAGGLLSAWEENAAPSLLFPNATYLVGREAWQRACAPHTRDRASFIPSMKELLEASGRLEIVTADKSVTLGENYHFYFTNGHTPGLMHTIVSNGDKPPIIFVSDLIPGSQWVNLPVTMGYDRAPELLVDEKRALLDYAFEKNAYLFYTHDPHVVMSQVMRKEEKYSPYKMMLSDAAVCEL
jgi:glyoxylase-like metal-dependent hydrolase (beta-lactamase superfamily II)